MLRVVFACNMNKSSPSTCLVSILDERVSSVFLVLVIVSACKTCHIAECLLLQSSNFMSCCVALGAFMCVRSTCHPKVANAIGRVENEYTCC